MSATDDDGQLHETVAPDMDLSQEDRQRAEAIIEAIDGLDTVTEDEIEERYFEKSRTASFWQDEFSGAPEFELAKYRLPALGLPGFGEAYDGSEGNIPCGTDIPHFCTDCGHTFSVGRTCKRNRCPRCAPAWVTDIAPGHVGRIQEAAKMKSAAMDGTAVYKHHGTISPPPEMFIDAEDPIGEAFHVIRDIMEAIGMEGVVYYHPYRGKGEAGEDESKDDRGEWKKRLFNDRNWEGDVREELRHSPHFHIIGACPWFPGGDVTSTVFEETGWFIKRFTERNGSAISLGDMGSVARAVTYCLSHTGIDTTGDQNRAQFRAYGSAYHAADYRERTQREAKRAVAWAAQDTLGLDSGKIECKNELPEDEQDHEPDPDLTADETDEEGSETTTDENGMVTCRGDVRDIDRAERFLSDEQWRTEAKHVEDLQTTWDEWQEVGGWQGWVDGQQTLEDDPPPD